MKTIISIFSLLTTFISVIHATPDPNFHIYLSFGQSNMEGAGEVEEVDKTVDSRFKVLSTVNGECYKFNRELGQWYDAIPPLSNCNGGLGVTDYFGRTLVKNLPENIRVGSVVVAIAGSSIEVFEEDYQNYDPADWMKGIISWYGGNPYGRLVEMAKVAQEVGVIKGILLHQGESNNGDPTWPSRIKRIYERLLNDLNLKASEVPLLAGELVQTEQGGLCGGMNPIIDTLPDVIPTAHVISSNDLQHKGDGLHFTSESYRKYGERYANVMLKLLKESQATNITATTTTEVTTTTTTTTTIPTSTSSSAPTQTNGDGPICCKQGICVMLSSSHTHC